MTKFGVLFAAGFICHLATAAPTENRYGERGIHERIAQLKSCVVSVAKIETDGHVARIVSTHGTAFFIGTRGFALTAKHVIAGKTKPLTALSMAEASGWTSVNIVASEVHPSEDVAIIKLDPRSCKTGFQLSNSFETASFKYHIFGYPGDATRLEAAKGEFPDMVYTEGYIRRRYSASIYPPTEPPPPAGTTVVTGNAFFELSQISGTGTSGGPVFDFGDPIMVIGIYSAEKHTPHLISRGDRPVIHLMSVSYAVRDDAFRDWKPALLGGKTVLEESQPLPSDRK